MRAGAGLLLIATGIALAGMFGLGAVNPPGPRPALIILGGTFFACGFWLALSRPNRHGDVD